MYLVVPILHRFIEGLRNIKLIENITFIFQLIESHCQEGRWKWCVSMNNTHFGQLDLCKSNSVFNAEEIIAYFVIEYVCCSKLI